MTLIATSWTRNSRPVVGAAISKNEHKGKFMSESKTSVTESNPSVKLIPLTQGKHAIVDASDYEWLNQWRWCAWTPDKRTFYAKRGVVRDGKDVQIFMHVVVFGEKMVDHKDRNGLNNCRSNLRESNKSTNGANRGPNKNNTSGFKGVSFFKATNRWKASLMVRGATFHLGYFLDKVEAAKEYDRRAIQHFGEFAKTNQSLGLLTQTQ